MAEITSSLTVYFENPFWVGIIECGGNGVYEVSKVIFGAEPTDPEIYEFILKRWDKLKFISHVSRKPKSLHVNPKRMQREIKKCLSEKGVGTKAQQALSRERELQKEEKTIFRRIKKEEEKKQKFVFKQAKKKEKKKGH